MTGCESELEKQMIGARAIIEVRDKEIAEQQVEIERLKEKLLIVDDDACGEHARCEHLQAEIERLRAERLHYALRVLLASRLRMPIADIHESDVDNYCNSILTIVKAAGRQEEKT